MRIAECPREDELLAALQTCSWPDRCPQELQDHVTGCAHCTSLAAIVLPLLDEHRLASASAPVPFSGAVWWRAQMRARQEAAQAAARPISIAQAVGLACAIGILAGCITLLAPSVGAWLGLAGSLPGALPSLQLPAVSLSDVYSLAPATLAVLLALLTMVLLAPVAIYLSQPE